MYTFQPWMMPCNMMMNQGMSYARFFHAVPDAPAVDIYVDGTKVVENIVYKMFSPYMMVSPGKHKVVVYPAGNQESAVFETDIVITPGSVSTFALSGQLPNIEVFNYPQLCLMNGMMMNNNMMSSNGMKPGMKKEMPFVRFIHLSPNAPAVDIRLADGTVIFSDVTFGEFTGYIPVPAGTYNLQVVPTGTDEVVLTVEGVKVEDNNVYTIYAVGVVGGKIPLEALMTLDGSY